MSRLGAPGGCRLTRLARVSLQRRKDCLHAARIHHRLHARLTACSDRGQSGNASCGNDLLAQVPQDRSDRRSRPAPRSDSLGAEHTVLRDREERRAP